MAAHGAGRWQRAILDVVDREAFATVADVTEGDA